MKAIDILVDLQKTAAANQGELVKKVDAGFSETNQNLLTIHEAMAAHALDDMKRFAGFDRRLEPIESLRRTVRWATGTAFVASLGFIADVLYRHLHP